MTTLETLEAGFDIIRDPEKWTWEDYFSCDGEGFCADGAGPSSCCGDWKTPFVQELGQCRYRS